jgi:glycosyltransferase involved in cell wall biosynthesis
MERLEALRWDANTHLAAVVDGAGWSLDHDVDELVRLIIRAGGAARATTAPWARQPAFFASRVAALRGVDRWNRMGVSVCFPYFHGFPGEGEAIFDETFERFRRDHSRVARVQVTNSRMRELLLETGISPEKVHTILIGVDSGVFVVPTEDQRLRIRDRLGIPRSAVVVGSFQKDGNGWAEGFEPKLIKGPDVLLAAVTRLKAVVPEVFVLLSGPARGYVRRGLDAAGIPYKHTTVARQREVAELFHALDVYIVASRQEGGPKAILESMASGVPVITTRVGQAEELVRHGENGWLVDVEDVDALANFALRSTVCVCRMRLLCTSSAKRCPSLL